MKQIYTHILVSFLSIVVGALGTTIALINSEKLQATVCNAPLVKESELIGVLRLLVEFSMGNKKQWIHELQEPLLFEKSEGEKPHYLLAAGTTLFYHRSMPEGFDTFIVYVNYKGPPLSLKLADKPNLVAPIWAHQIEK